MSWLWSSSKQDKPAKDFKKDDNASISSYSRGQKILLEDTKPRFGKESMSVGEVSRLKEQSTLKAAVSSITKEDFSLGKLVMIPCFRDAGMMGFSSMFVVGSIIFLYHKNVTKATNWAMGSLALGSIIGWEQCRNTRRRSFQNAERARKVVLNKQKPMLHEVPHAEEVRNQWGRVRQNDAVAAGSTGGQGADSGKKWYKFW